MLDLQLYTRSIPLPRECLYNVASPRKHFENHSLSWTGHFIYPLHPAPPSRECLYQVISPGKTAEKNDSWCWIGHFIPVPSRSPEQRIASPGKTSEKTTLMLEWPLYTCSIPLPVQVKPLKKTTVDVGLATLYPLHPAPRAENASIKWSVQVKPLKKRQLMLDCPLYTRSILLHWTENASIKWPVQVKTFKKTTADVGLATLYPLHPAPPSRNPERRINL